MAENAGEIYFFCAVIVTAQECLAHRAQASVDVRTVRFAIEAGILVEGERKYTVAGETIRGLAQHRGTEAFPESPGIDAVVGICVSQLAPACGQESRCKDDRLYLLMACVEQFVDIAQVRCPLAGIDDGVPFARFRRVGGTDTHAKDDILTTSVGRLPGLGLW